MKAVSVKLLAIMAAGAFVFAACSSSDSSKATTTTKAAATTTTEAASKFKSTATPTEDLTNGAAITVKVSGFTAGKTLGIIECAQAGDSETGQADCDLAGMTVITAGADGSGEGVTKANKGPVGENAHMCGTAGVRCFLSVGELTADGGERTDDIDIAFAP